MKRLWLISLALLTALLTVTVIPACAVTYNSSYASSNTSSRKVTIEDVIAGAADIYDLYGSDYKVHIPDAAKVITYDYMDEWNGYIENGVITLTEHSRAKDREIIKVPSYIEFYQGEDVEPLKIPVKHLAKGVFYAHDKMVEVVIPNGIETIGANAFRDCTSLRKVTLPSTLISVGSMAFAGHHRIDEINIPDLAAWCAIDFDGRESNPLCRGEALYVDGEAFFEIPEGVTEIKPYCFTNCDSLRKLKLPKSLKTIGTHAFYKCVNLRYLEFNEGIELIEDRAFEGCAELELSIFPESLKTIGNYAFSGCRGMTEAVFGKALERIGQDAFSACESMTGVYFLNNDTVIHRWCFGSIQSELPNVTVFGSPGSTSEKFATELKLKFTDISSVDLPTEKPKDAASSASDVTDSETKPSGNTSDGRSPDNPQNIENETPWWLFAVLGAAAVLFVAVLTTVIVAGRKRSR